MSGAHGMQRPKVAVVLFNLGGPDRPEAIAPFLRNLFSDPAVLAVPWPIRPVLARRIAARRLGPARVSYAHLGGRSPLRGETEQQGRLLEAALPELEARAFVAMRYWAPMSGEAARAVAEWDPDEIVLLPLYPHFSVATTGSSLTAWRQAALAAGLVKETRTICCWYEDAAFIAAWAAIVRQGIAEAREALPPATRLRVLFSAHGLPERIVRAGDPYRMQVERTMAAVLAAVGENVPEAKLCFQSRATPERWLAPSTDDEIRRAGAERTALLVVPIAFVSEHSETLVELDIDYRKLAEESGVPGFFRAPTPGISDSFITALAGLVRQVRALPPGLATLSGCGACGSAHRRCLKEVSPR
ncbi:MAG: ferrochelatase [Acetobacteraceae bacterium]